MSYHRAIWPAIVLAAACLACAPLASAQCVPDEFPPGWLQQQEDLGGHTIARHVDKTDQQLVERLRADSRITAASTYPDQATAQTNIEAALAASRAQINNWANEAEEGAVRAYDFNAGHTVGRVALRPPGQSNIIDSSKLRAVMKKTRGGCYLLTSYTIE